MIKVTVCIGSACHLKGSRQVVEIFQNLLASNHLSDRLELGGTFCMGRCDSDGVCVTVDGEAYAVKPEEAQSFFYDVIAAKINNA